MFRYMVRAVRRVIRRDRVTTYGLDAACVCYEIGLATRLYPLEQVRPFWGSNLRRIRMRNLQMPAHFVHFFQDLRTAMCEEPAMTLEEMEDVFHFLINAPNETSFTVQNWCITTPEAQLEFARRLLQIIKREMENIA